MVLWLDSACVFGATEPTMPRGLGFGSSGGDGLAVILHIHIGLFWLKHDKFKYYFFV